MPVQSLQKITGLYRGLLLFNLIMLVVIVYLYPEPFSLAWDPISWLGKIGPGNGQAHYNSFWLFSSALVFNIIIWIQIIIIISKHPAWKNQYVRFSFWFVSVGFLLMLFPCDRFDAVHSSGGALVGIGLWILSTMMLIRLGFMFNKFHKIGLHLFLHFSALFCIANFALNTALKGFSQRPAILAIIVVTNICLHLQLKALLKPNTSNNIPGDNLLS